MSCQEPKPRTTTSSATTKNDNPMSCRQPKPRMTSSTTTKNDNHMSYQEPKYRTTLSKTVILKELMLIIPIIGVLLLSVITKPPHAQDPKPTQWPDKFHSRIVMNNTGIVELVDLWYEWTNGRSLIIIQCQGGSVLYDLEWHCGPSFHYTVGSHGTCSSSYMEGDGILKPDWLDQMSYVDQREVDGSLCNVWENPEFITYYEDVITKRPVHWALYTDLPNESGTMASNLGRKGEALAVSGLTEYGDDIDVIAPADILKQIFKKDSLFQGSPIYCCTSYGTVSHIEYGDLLCLTQFSVMHRPDVEQGEKLARRHKQTQSTEKTIFRNFAMHSVRMDGGMCLFNSSNFLDHYMQI